MQLMPVLNCTAGFADLEAMPWRNVLNAKPSTCESYCGGFCRLANEAESSAAPATFAAARMLSYICTLKLHPDDRFDPLRSINPDLTLS
jgi:hypothetical protein